MLIGGRAHSLEEANLVGEAQFDFAEINLLDPHHAPQELTSLLALKEKFNFSGTNGYTAEIDASSDSDGRYKQSAIGRAKVIMSSNNSVQSTEYCGLPTGTQTRLLDASSHTQTAESSAAIGHQLTTVRRLRRPGMVDGL